MNHKCLTSWQSHNARQCDSLNLPVQLWGHGLIREGTQHTWVGKYSADLGRFHRLPLGVLDHGHTIAPPNRPAAPLPSMAGRKIGLLVVLILCVWFHDVAFEPAHLHNHRRSKLTHAQHDAQSTLINATRHQGGSCRALFGDLHAHLLRDPRRVFYCRAYTPPAHALMHTRSLSPLLSGGWEGSLG